MAATDEAILEGAISVLAALRGRNRDIYSVWISKDRDTADIAPTLRAAREAGVPVMRVDRDEIESRAAGNRHGGLIAVVGPRHFVAISKLVPAGRPAFIIMIDGVEDPYNFGAAVRSLYAAGADGLVVRPRNWMTAAGIVARASAGASELLPTAVAVTALEASEYFETRGLVVACTATRNATSLYRADLTVPLFLLVGGEQRGITRSALRGAALRLRIPYARPDAMPLGTAAATAVIAFEVARQRADLALRPRIS